MEEEVEELAGHLEDLAADSSERGESGFDAVRRAVLQETDWSKLDLGIHLAIEEENMNDRVRRVWLPGAAMVALAHGLWWGLLRAGLDLSFVWDDSRPLMFFFVPWLLLLPLVGGLAAFWSRRYGGNKVEMLLISLFPAFGFAVVFLLGLVVALFADLEVPAAFKLKLFVATLFSLVVVPGIALAIGALPLLAGRKPRVTA